MNREQISAWTRHFSGGYGSARMPDFPSRSFSPEFFGAVIDRIVERSSGRFEISTVGHSFEGRPIRLVGAGTGPTTVFLWSQMHGDESTASMALADILGYLSSTGTEEMTSRILSGLALRFLPMVNPDGAARFQRRTAQGIDMNRDALTLATPEARLLKHLQHQLRPAFGFNLHDQELSTVGSARDLTAIALLAPAADPEQSVSAVRARALHLAAVFTSSVEQLVPGRVCRYDDTFEPRAFGDNVQRWGTSTILVESGHTVGDPLKDTARKLNFVGILTSLYAIATGGYVETDLRAYLRLPFNGKKAYDVIVRNVTIDHGEGRSTTADLGVTYQVDTHSEMPPKLADIGDLSTFAAMVEVDGRGRSLSASALGLGKEFDWEQAFRGSPHQGTL